MTGAAHVTAVIAAILMSVLRPATQHPVLALPAAAALFGWLVWKSRTSGHLPGNRVRHMRLRLRFCRRPGRGHATLFSLWLRWGRFAALREAGRVRPSLSAWQLIRHPQAHSVYLGRAHWRHTVRVSIQEHLAILGPPRSFKTALLTKLILDAPGSVVSTSSKPDVFTRTSGVRALRGPVEVFNPQGIGGIPSTIRWSPVSGCTDPTTAMRRAVAFAAAVHTGGTDDGEFWDSTASGCLQALFTAAALVGADMRLVARWAHGEHTGDAIDVLKADGRDQFAGALHILVGKAEKTAETVRAVLNRALGFMADPQLAGSVLPREGDGFDAGSFLLAGGSLYMIAKSQQKDAALGPVFAALASEIQFTATQVASQMPGGRLDPPLMMALDEVTQICPVPLPLWLADSGGQGIQVISAFHGIAQLQERWGRYGAQTVIDTSNVRAYLGGGADVETLQHASTLCGQASYREHGEDRQVRTEVMAPDMIRAIPRGYGLLVRGGEAPVIARLARGWKDRQYKRAKRRGYAVAPLTPAPAARALDPFTLALLDLAGDGGGTAGALEPLRSVTDWPNLLAPDAPAAEGPAPAQDPPGWPRPGSARRSR